MKRGELYLVRRPGTQDPRKQRVFRRLEPPGAGGFPILDLDLRARLLTARRLNTQVRVGTAEGLKTESSIHCDELVSLPKTALTHYVGSLKPAALRDVNAALAVALELEDHEPSGFAIV